MVGASVCVYVSQAGWLAGWLADMARMESDVLVERILSRTDERHTRTDKRTDRQRLEAMDRAARMFDAAELGEPQIEQKLPCRLSAPPKC